ncbi:glycoside hydrolase family 76 protein [Dysgonomonas gadei]|uniref:Uncharacterized protein n=1 Tax=Dysgonomonas gadei ATCC BAA-286 TaxID=742766 RepID=F5J2A7_9BACT|nr:glycoside hydrolase family 76 protein [Dysgonomonas gadei]EGK00227.1 hypothetical protein HMPREF9455_03366 [Dysgonomonas gadei ATCC BAA-286]
MKNILLVLTLIFLYSCNDDNDIPKIADRYIPEEVVKDEINPVINLSAQFINVNNDALVTWLNPEDKHLSKIEISYRLKDAPESSNTSIQIDALPSVVCRDTIKIPAGDDYIVSLVAINEIGARSEARITDIGAFYDPKDIPLFLNMADTLMTSVIKLYFGGKYDAWNSSYPNVNGPYWDGIAAVWGQGSAFSGYTNIREASLNSAIEQKYTNYDDRFLYSINKFRNKKGGRAEAYGTYIGDNDERFYDDNVWIGIDMVNLYEQTGKKEYLDNAEMVWRFLLQGTDNIMGGGIYWKEDSQSKHTCSTAPAAVMAARLYLQTNDESYLKSAKELYSWCKTVLQDPSDYLYWDNARLNDPNDPNSGLQVETSKYSYNSGQPMQAAALLYKITKDPQYLTDAQNIAEASYNRFFKDYYSAALGQNFKIVESSHVWFNAILFRGFVELYKIDNNNKYVTSYAKTMQHVWKTSRNTNTNLLNEDYCDGNGQSSWDILQQGAFVEILSVLGQLERQGLL